MHRVTPLLARLSHSTALKLMLLAFAVYNLNLRSITSFDTNATRYLPISILREFDLDLDEFPFLHRYPEKRLHQHDASLITPAHQKSQGAVGPLLPHYLSYTRGHYMSTYPVMPAILSVPVYALPVWLGLTDGPTRSLGFTQTEIVGTLLSKLSASAAVAISVGLVYLALLRLTHRRAAFWVALIYGFATSSWSVSSQGLWQNAMSQPCLALALYCFVRASERPRHVLFAGLAVALSVTCRPHDFLFAIVFFIFVLHQYRAQIFRFMIFPILIGGLFFTYNVYYFGTLAGGYTDFFLQVRRRNIPIEVTTGQEGAEPSAPTESIKVEYEKFASLLKNFINPRLSYFLGLLVSPSRGLLVYSPVLIFSGLGLVIVLYSPHNTLLIYTAAASLLTLLFYSSLSHWHGDFGYSYRFLVDLLPGLILLLGVAYNRIVASGWMKGLFVTLAAFSVCIQVIGTFFYPCDWLTLPVPAAQASYRFWDWGDPEFVRCLRAGPIRPEGLDFLESLASGSGKAH